MEISEEVSKTRLVEYGINPLFVVRWSPRAFSGEALTDGELSALFEAGSLGSFVLQQPIMAFYLRKARHASLGEIF